MNRSIAFLLAAFGMSAALSAQQVEVGGFLSYASGLTMKSQVTHRDMGMGLEVGLRVDNNRFGIPTRFGLTYGTFPGAETMGVKRSLTLVQLASDVYIPREVLPKTRLGFGISLNKWSLTHEALGVKTNPEIKGLKVGARMSLETEINKNLRLNATLQAVDLGSSTHLGPGGDVATAVVNVNPSWIQIGVRYAF